MLTALKKFDETSFPSKEAFNSKLTGEGITDEDYQHTQTVLKEFNIESMKDYHNLYNLSVAICRNLYYYQLMFLKTLGIFT